MRQLHLIEDKIKELEERLDKLKLYIASSPYMPEDSKFKEADKVQTELVDLYYQKNWKILYLTG
jgi:hypothetical protein